MSDWRDGDLGVAVDGVCPSCERKYSGIEVGKVYEFIGYGDSLCASGRGLAFASVDNCDDEGFFVGWCAADFRKIDKHEACEDEFVTLLKRTKRRVDA